MKNKVLFVEDEADLTLIVADTLRGLGYDVVTAADGVEGLDRYRSEGADIIVADVMMPRMDGFTMAKGIRKMSPEVPLLFLTAKSTIDDVEDKSTELSHFESKILERLAANIGKTVDASELMIAVWQRDDTSSRNSLHGYIHKLRRALRHDPNISIINQRGFGYMLTIKQ